MLLFSFWSFEIITRKNVEALFTFVSRFFKFSILFREKTNQSNEICHKWNMQYPYPVPFNKRYSKTNKYMITAFYIMMLHKRASQKKFLNYFGQKFGGYNIKSIKLNIFGWVFGIEIKIFQYQNTFVFINFPVI